MDPTSSPKKRKMKTHCKSTQVMQQTHAPEQLPTPLPKCVYQSLYKQPTFPVTTQTDGKPDFVGDIIDNDTGALLEYKQLSKHPQYKQTRQHSYGNKIGRFAQVMPGQVQGTNSIIFVRKQDIPTNRKKDITYRQIICDYWPGKAEPNRTRLMVGGNRINYPEDCGTLTVDLLTIKLMLNSIISTQNAKFMTMDIKNFYLNTP